MIAPPWVSQKSPRIRRKMTPLPFPFFKQTIIGRVFLYGSTNFQHAESTPGRQHFLWWRWNLFIHQLQWQLFELCLCPEFHKQVCTQNSLYNNLHILIHLFFCSEWTLNWWSLVASESASLSRLGVCCLPPSPSRSFLPLNKVSFFCRWWCCRDKQFEM